MNEVLTTPDARPDWLGATSLMAASITGLSAMPQPRPSRSMPGRTCTRKLPPTGASANSASPAADSSMPAMLGARMP